MKPKSWGAEKREEISMCVILFSKLIKSDKYSKINSPPWELHTFQSNLTLTLILILISSERFSHLQMRFSFEMVSNNNPRFVDK